jgi:hypothetical protein
MPSGVLTVALVVWSLVATVIVATVTIPFRCSVSAARCRFSFVEGVSPPGCLLIPADLKDAILGASARLVPVFSSTESRLKFTP